MTTTDAEAIARIIDPGPFTALDRTTVPVAPEEKTYMDDALTKANRILSYLASRREAQEPVDWIYEDELPSSYPYGRMFAYSKVRDGVRMFPVYAPPAPAGEVERMRAAIKRQVENIDRWRETGEPASPEESKSIYEQLVAALNGGRAE